MVYPVARILCRRGLVNTGVAAANSSRQAHHVAKTSKPLMDLLPIPEGPWEEYHNKQNAKYNIHLITGITFFVVTYAIAFSTGNLFMNGLPPPLPASEKKK